MDLRWIRLWTGALAALVLAPCVLAQDAPSDLPAVAEAAAPAADTALEATPESAAAPTVRFNLNGMPYDQVLDVIARQTGLPVIRQCDVPNATMTFISPETYPLDKAVEIINLAFKAHGVRLEQDKTFLYLRTIEDVAKRPTPVGSPDDLQGVDPDTYATVFIPLQNAMASVVAERLQPLVAPPGLVQAIQEQNMLILVETAEQCQRLAELVGRIDAERPADVDFGLYPLKHTEARTIVETLRSLVPERDRLVTMDKNQTPQVYDDVSKPALKLSADERLNAVVAVGPPTRLDVVQELVTMLDVPTGGAGDGDDGTRVTRTFVLEEITPDEAARQLAPLFNDEPERVRPILQPLASVGKLVAVGSEAQIARLSGVLVELDPGVLDRDGRAMPVTRAIALEHLSTGDAEGLARRLLTPRQQRVLRFAPMPGGKRLIATGPGEDVDALETLLKSLDVRPEQDVDARLIAIRAGDPASVINEAARVDGLTDEGKQDPVQPILDAESRSATLVGSRNGISRFERRVREVEDSLARRVQTRVIDVRNVEAGKIVQAILDLVASNEQASGHAPPEIRVIELSNSLVVTADAEVLGLVDQFARRLDRVDERPASAWKTFELKTARADEVARTLDQTLNDRARWPEDLVRAERSGQGPARPTVRADAAGNRVIVSAPEALMAIAEEVVAALDSGTEPAPVEVRAFRLREGDANSIAQALRAGLTANVRPGEPAPTVTPEAGSNTIIVTGSADAMRRAEDLVAAMDEHVEVGGLGVRTIVLKHARAEAVAPLVERVLSQDRVVDLVPEWLRWQMVWELERRNRPVDLQQVRVQADDRLNAVVVSAPLELLDLAEEVASSLDVEPTGGAVGDRPVRVIALVNADASQVEGSVRAMFEGQEDVERAPTVRADRSSNALVVRGTSGQLDAIEALAKRLDVAAGASSRNVRTIPLDPSRLDAQDAARTIRRLLERRGGVRVEVISADELLGDKKDDPSEPAQESGDEGGESHSDAGWGAPAGWMVGPMLGWAPDPVPTATSKAKKDVKADDKDGAAAGDEDEVPVVRIVVDPSTNSLVVEGSDRVSERVQQLAAELQRRSPREPTTVRIVELPAGSDPNAVASFVNQTVRELGRTSQDNPGGFSGRVTVSPDRTSGTLIVWANDTDFGTVKDLIAGLTRLDRSVSLSVKIYPLNNTQAGRARQSVMELLNPQQGPGRRSGEVELTIPDGKGGEQKATIDSSRVTVTTDPSLTSLIVTAPAGSFGVIDRFVQMIDESPVLERLAIRRYELAHASAGDLERTMQVLFDSQRQGPVAWEQPRARFVADDRANALLVTATDEQHAEIARILQDADQSLEQDDTQLAILRVEEGRPSAIGRVIQEVLVGRDPAKKDSLRISAQDDTGVLVVRAPDADMEEIRSLVTQLDQTQGASYPVRSIKLKNGDAAAIAGSLQQFFRDRARINRQRGKAGGGGDAAIVGDQRSGTIVVSASDEDYEQIAGLVEQFDAPAAGKQFKYEIIPLQHVQVSDIGQTVQNIMWEMQWERSGYFRGGSGATNEDKVYVETNDRTNSVVVFGQGEMFEVVERIIAELDQPNSDAGKVIVKAVRAPGVDLGAVERIIEQMTATPGWRVWQGRDPNAVQVEVDRRRQALILIGKQAVVEDAEKQIAEIVKGGLDEGQVVEIVVLQEARAQELAQALQRALPEGLEVKITPVSRTNSILLTGSAEDVAAVKGQIAELDKEPERAPVEFRRFALKHADALDLSLVLKALVRNRPRGQGEPVPGIDALYNENTLAVTASPTEMSFIAEMVEQFDVAQETERKTEFVKLEYADAGKTAEALKVFYGRYAPEAATSAERSVSIVPDPASNSLVISADESTWEGIHNLLTKLDTADYDTSQQLVVIPLKHASATSVARALNEGFRQPLQDQLDQERVRLEAERRRQGNSNSNRDFFEPTVLVESEGVPVVSAETQTNSLIVFAGRKELDRIRQIVSQLDVADFLELPAARIVPIKAGRASQLADSARRVFVTEQDGANPRGVQIIGDDASSTVLVRADDDKFAEIRSFLADMEARASLAQASARIIRLRSIPAARVQQAVLQSLRPVAQQRGEPLSVQVEATTNSLIVSASAELHKQVESLVRELDGDPAPAGEGKGGDADVPGFGQNVTVVAVKSSDPAQIVQRLNAMGVTRAQAATSPGVVAEPVGLIPMPDQSAIGVVGSARDTAIVQRLIEVLDDGSPEGEQQVAFVRLKLADAGAVVQRLRQMLSPQGSVTGAGQAGALAEQVRRLRLEQDGKAVELDLTSPVRLVPEAGSNAVIVASTAGNVAAIESVIGVLDQLPIGEAVMVKIFPLENASADRVRGILDELFRQGDRLRRVPGTNRQGDPTTTVGEALAGNVALTVDERTNALVAAGPEASLALVEVLVSDLDAQDAERGWLETSLIQLDHADARTLADKLREVLVKGIGQTPEAVALRRQIGRLRVKPGEGEGVEADLYAPLSGVVITPEEDLNALIVVATPTNVRAVKELVAMLDVERASAANEVRVIPMEHADAARVADIVRGTFEERSRLPAARPEDKVIVNVDERTNALIVSTSRRSFEILDGLIATLDQEESRFAVGLHVIPVPGADVEALAPRLQRLMQDRLRAARERGGRSSPQDVFRVEPDAASGVLIVAASEENLQLVRELVASLTTGEAPAAKGEVTALVQLASPGRAREVADAVGELYVSPQNERRGARAVTVVPNERLNALLVTGTEDDVTQIRAIADRLDRAEVGLVEDVRRIPLESASARETVSLIEDVLAGRSIAGSRTGSRATRVRVISDRLAEAKAEATIDGDIRDQVNLTPDPRTNSVLIKAPPELMDLIVTIVQDLDHETRGDRVIETFRLVNADAAQMQQLLIDLFNLQQSGDRYVLAPSRDQQPDDDTQLAPSFTAIPDERQELAVTIDRRTNTLLVSGTSDLIEEVKRVVSSLDSIQANERERLVYHLKNAQAAEIEQTLQAYFQGEADLVRTTLGPDVSGSVLRELEQEVTVIGDPNSNKLVISASPRYIDTVTSIIDELDASPPQVMIEVLIAEVTLNASEEFGIDVAIGGTVATTSGSGLGSQSGSSKAGGDGYVFDALAAGSGVATALGVPNLAVASSDFGLLIRALQAQGKLEVLSRPQVQVNDNEAAFINVGENIAITDGVERRDNVTTAIVSRKDVGITLDVTPSISSDGYVRLDISPEISILSDRTTQISEDFEAPIITQRRVETTVTIKDGETVVIGGLIQTNDSQTKTKVPLLGDIPLVGGLFRTNEKSQIKTELLVILTPHVIPGERSLQTLERQRGLTDRAMNSLENRKPVEKMLELGHDPDDKVEIWEPIHDGKDDDE